MEMLIVVAIIVILIAIMIPTFNSQLEKTREAADAANIRAAYAEASVNYLDSEEASNGTSVELQQKKDGWMNTQLAENLKNIFPGDDNADVIDGVAAGQTLNISVDSEGNASISVAD